MIEMNGASKNNNSGKSKIWKVVKIMSFFFAIVVCFLSF